MWTRFRIAPRWRVLATALLIGCVCTSAASAARRPPLHWSAPEHVGHNGISALACPATRLCVAGSADGLLVSTDPAGGARMWKLVFTPLASGAAAPQVTSVSCTSRAFCAAVTLQGDLVTSTNPGGGRAGWTLTRLHLPAGVFPKSFSPRVSCASRSLCVAMSVGSRVVLSSKDPTGGARAWRSIQLKRPLQNVTCTAPHLCLLGDDRGDVLSSTKPTGGAGSWRSVHVFGTPGKPEQLTASACASVRYCMMGAIDFGAGVLLFASDPTGDINRSAGAWRDQVAIDPNQLFVSGSCTRGPFCAFLTTDGSVYFPTRSFRTLAHARVDHAPARDGGGGISCVSSHWCALGALDGNIYVGRSG